MLLYRERDGYSKGLSLQISILESYHEQHLEQHVTPWPLIAVNSAIKSCQAVCNRRAAI